MEIIIPTLGYFIWTLIIFTLLFLVLRKFAWKAILNAIKQREESITKALSEADNARQEMQNLKSENEKILQEARTQRDQLLAEAREIKEKIIGKAREEAEEEGRRLIENARLDIRSEKMAALTEIKNQVGKLSLEIAEKVLREQLASSDKQDAVIEKLISEIKLN